MHLEPAKQLLYDTVSRRDRSIYKKSKYKKMKKNIFSKIIIISTLVIETLNFVVKIVTFVLVVGLFNELKILVVNY